MGEISSSGRELSFLGLDRLISLFLQTMQPCLPHSAGKELLEGPMRPLLCSVPVPGPGGSKAFSRDHLG